MKIQQLEACILPLPGDAMVVPEKQVLQARPAGRSPLLDLELEVTHTMPDPPLLSQQSCKEASSAQISCSVVCQAASVVMYWSGDLISSTEPRFLGKMKLQPSLQARKQGSALLRAVKSRSGQAEGHGSVCRPYFAVRMKIRGLTVAIDTVCLIKCKDCPRSLSKLMKARWTQSKAPWLPHFC